MLYYAYLLDVEYKYRRDAFFIRHWIDLLLLRSIAIHENSLVLISGISLAITYINIFSYAWKYTLLTTPQTYSLLGNYVTYIYIYIFIFIFIYNDNTVLILILILVLLCLLFSLLLLVVVVVELVVLIMLMLIAIMIALMIIIVIIIIITINSSVLQLC